MLNTIGVSFSEPHTSELNSEFCIYMCMYICTLLHELVCNIASYCVWYLHELNFKVSENAAHECNNMDASLVTRPTFNTPRGKQGLVNIHVLQHFCTSW